MSNNVKVNAHMKWRDFGSESLFSLHWTNRYGSPDHLMGQSLITNLSGP